MSSVSAIALGDVAIAAVAILLFVYESWLFLRTGRALEHAYTAAVCLSAATFAVLMAIHYDAGPSLALLLTRGEAVALLLLMHSVIALCGALASRPLPFPTWVLGASGAICISLALSPWLIETVEPMRMSLLEHPFWRRPQTPRLTAMLIYGFCFTGFALGWLGRHGDDVRREARYFVLGIGAWLLTSVVAFALSLAHRTPPFSVAEYGFFAFALSMVARDTGRFIQMLQRSQTDVRHARSERHLAKELSSEVVASIDAGIVAVRNDFTIELWNPVMEELTRVARERAMGRELLDVLPHTCTPSNLEAALNATIAGERSSVEDLVLEAKDGPRRFEVTLSPRDLTSSHGGLILVLTDVTQRDRLTAQLMGIDRLAAVGTLAAGIGHEVNNPLSWLLLNLRTMQDVVHKGTPGEELERLLEESLDGAKRIRDIVDGLRAYSRIDDRCVAVDLSVVVRGALTLTNNDLRHRATVKLDIRDTPTVEAVEGRLGQVFVNLLINAGHAVEEGAVDERKVEVRVFEEQGEAIVEIIDTGAGIAESDLPRLFDPFFTTKSSAQGTGLGLGISREAVRGMGGRIEVETRPGRGSTFRVVLPKVDRPPDETTQSSPPESVPDGVRVLIVDDEPALGRALLRTLRRVGWTAEWVGSVEDALVKLEADTGFTAVLTDLSMPQRTGMELYDEARRRWPELEPRFLFMTGGTFTAEAADFRSEHEARVLDKPIRGSELVTRIGQLAS